MINTNEKANFLLFLISYKYIRNKLMLDFVNEFIKNRKQYLPRVHFSAKPTTSQKYSIYIDYTKNHMIIRVGNRHLYNDYRMLKYLLRAMKENEHIHLYICMTSNNSSFDKYYNRVIHNKKMVTELISNAQVESVCNHSYVEYVKSKIDEALDLYDKKSFDEWSKKLKRMELEVCLEKESTLIVQ